MAFALQSISDTGWVGGDKEVTAFHDKVHVGRHLNLQRIGLQKGVHDRIVAFLQEERNVVVGVAGSFGQPVHIDLVQDVVDVAAGVVREQRVHEFVAGFVESGKVGLSRPAAHLYEDFVFDFQMIEHQLLRIADGA